MCAPKSTKCFDSNVYYMLWNSLIELNLTATCNERLKQQTCSANGHIGDGAQARDTPTKCLPPCFSKYHIACC